MCVKHLGALRPATIFEHKGIPQQKEPEIDKNTSMKGDPQLTRCCISAFKNTQGIKYIRNTENLRTNN